MSRYPEATMLVLCIACSSITSAQTTPLTTPQTTGGISYDQSQLTIELSNVTLAEVLTKIGAATGVKIDIPAEATTIRVPNVKLGPGPAREVISSLLRDMHFNYIVQASDADPARLQGVLVIPEERNDAPESSVAEPMRAARMGRTQAEALARQEAAAQAVALAAQNADQSMPKSDQSDSPSTDNPQASTMARESAFSGAQPAANDGPRPGALTPPAVLNQSSINQQLQQMYQQRAQMTQQSHQAGAQQ